MNGFLFIAGCVVTAMVATAMLLIGKAEVSYVQEPLQDTAAPSTVGVGVDRS